jgi:D-3-phosphoglycerate dehydrogenase
VETLVIGDHFIAAGVLRDAIERELGSDFGPVRAVAWSGADREEQHEQQQVMEKEGPEAVPEPGDIVEAAAGAEIIAVHFAPISRAVLEASSRLKAVVLARTGVENVNLEEASRRGVAVVNVYGRNANAVAEQAIAFMLAETRDVARADATIKSGGWPEEPESAVFELAGSTVGLIGLGNVGRIVARKLASLEMRVLVYDPYVDAATIQAHGGEKVDDLDTVFREGDIVSLHARLTQETHRFIGRAQLELMKPTAYFINNARSRMVDYDALYDVLATRRIAGAALDVHEDEPLASDSPWRRLGNVTLAPHTAGATPEVWTNSARLVAQGIAAVARGGAANTVNAEALGSAR